jgi:hypothetical protein
MDRVEYFLNYVVIFKFGNNFVKIFFFKFKARMRKVIVQTRDGCQSNGLKKEKNVFLGGVQSKSQEKVRKNEKSENKKYNYVCTIENNRCYVL